MRGKSEQAGQLIALKKMLENLYICRVYFVFSLSKINVFEYIGEIVAGLGILFIGMGFIYCNGTIKRL